MSDPQFNSEAYTPDDLVLSGFPVKTEEFTLVSGENLGRGAVLGQITASGKLNLSLSAAVDGSQTPMGVLAEPCDASGGDKKCLVYLTGAFNTNKLTIGTGHTADSIRDGLYDKNIYLEVPVDR